MVDYIKKLIDYYYTLTIRNLRESIPKSMAFNFINELRNIRGHILMKIVQQSQEEDMLAEDPAISSKRKFHKDILKILEQSEKIMLGDEE
jgi:hypothetical protein